MSAPASRSPHCGFETVDLSLASYLRCRSFGIEDVRQSELRTVFIFNDSSELRRAILDYANDGPVQVRTFCNTLRDLKALVRDFGAADGRRNDRGHTYDPQ